MPLPPLPPLLLLLLLLAAAPAARAVLCYQCNSRVDPGCDPLPPAPANGTARYLLPCDEDRQGHAPFCRKSVIKVLTEERVARSCGWILHHSECYKYDDDDHHELVCQCFSDGCNGAPGGPAGPAPALLAALPPLLLLLLLR